MLAPASFATGTEAYVYAGHLADLAADLDASVAAAGQLATAFAITYTLTAPLVAGAMARFGRRTVMVMGLMLIGALNLLAGAAPSLAALMAIRVACGLAAGLVGPISPLAAAELAAPGQRGGARWPWSCPALRSPSFGHPGGQRRRRHRGLARYLRLCKSRCTGCCCGHTRRFARHAWRAARGHCGVSGGAGTRNIGEPCPNALGHCGYLYDNLLPWSHRDGNFGPYRVGHWRGAGDVRGWQHRGTVVGARAADRPQCYTCAGAQLRRLGAVTGAYSALMLAPAATGVKATGLLAAATALGAAALFARAPVIQVRLVAAAPEKARPVVLALNRSMVFLGQGLGAAVGGLVIAGPGLPWVGLAAACLALFGAGLAVRPSRLVPNTTNPAVVAE